MDKADVVVVGAGAAGIGAALECRARGLSCIVLEAADRIGGRAYTTTAGLQRPWDLGCHWMHGASQNPMVAHADALGARYAETSGWEKSMLWSNGVLADPSDCAASEEATEAAFDAVYEAGAAGQDVPVTDVLPDLGRWSACAHHVLQLEIGDDPDLASAAGYSDYADTGEDWPVLIGYGDLITRMAAGLDIRLSTLVHRIAEHRAGLSVETASGSLSARAAIVTVSTNVLASGAITLPPGDARAFARKAALLPCGVFEKVAFTLTHLPPALGENRHVMVNRRRRRTGD